MPSTLGIVASGYKAWDPKDLGADLKAWWDTSDSTTITLNGSTVSALADKSGNGFTLSQGTASAQPTSGSQTQNSLNVLTFDGGDWLAAATKSDWRLFHQSGAHAVIAAYRVNPGAQRYHGLMGTNASNQRGFDMLYDNSNKSIRHVSINSDVSQIAANASGANAFTADAMHIVSFLADLGNSTAANRSVVRVDGGSDIKNNSQTASTTTGNDPQSVLCVGRRSNTTGDVIMIGWFAELIVVTGSSATAATVATARSYLNAKWAVY